MWNIKKKYLHHYSYKIEAQVVPYLRLATIRIDSLFVHRFYCHYNVYVNILSTKMSLKKLESILFFS